MKLIIAAGGASEEGDDVEELAKKELSEFDMAEFDLDNDGQLSLSETMVRTIEFEKDEDQLNSWRA